MPPGCSVVICKNRGNNVKGQSISFHMFPRDPELRQQWIDATGHGRGWQPDSRNNTICSEHFKEKCYQKFKNSRRLFVWALPTLKLRYKLESTTETPVTSPSKVANQDQEALTDRPATTGGRCQHALVTKDICSKCKREFFHRETDMYLGNRSKSIVAHVYGFFQNELKEIKDMYGDKIDCSPFAKLRQRTSEATGVCLNSVRRILKEEHEWNDKWKKKRKKLSDKAVSLLMADDNDESDNKCKKNCDIDCENMFGKPKVQEKEAQTEGHMNDSNFDINENKIGNDEDSQVDVTETEDVELGEETAPTTKPTDMSVSNDDGVAMETQPDTVLTTQNFSLESNDSTKSQSSPDIVNSQQLDTTNCKTQTEPNTEDKTNNTKDDAVPMVLNIVITEEEFYKTHENGLEPGDEIVTLETEDVEFEFHEIVPSTNSDASSTNTTTQIQPNDTAEQQYYRIDPSTNSASTNTNTTTQTQPNDTAEQPYYRIDPSTTNASPNTNTTAQTNDTTEQRYYSLEPMNPMINQMNGTLVSAKPQYCSIETVNPLSQTTGTQLETQPLYTTAPQYCSLETINPASTQPLITREPQYYSLETINPMMSQINSTLMPSEPQYCSIDPNNPMLSQPATSQQATQPLMLTDQLYCSMNPTMNATGMLGPPNLVHMDAQQQLMSSEPQYISTAANCQTMAALPRADFTNGLNYYVIM